MDINTLRTLVTLASFAVFVGIIWWTYSPKRSEDFSQAERLRSASRELQNGTSPTGYRLRAGSVAGPRGS